ncbi:MAG: NfeD family protein [Kovacikia sp.]
MVDPDSHIANNNFFALDAEEVFLENAATVTEVIKPHRSGRVFFKGTYWFARCNQEVTLNPDTTVRVIAQHNLILPVEPIPSKGCEVSSNNEEIASQQIRAETQILSSIRLLIQDAFYRGATAIYLQVGRPPFYRINGKLLPQKHVSTLSSENFQNFISELLTSEQLEQYQTLGKLDADVSINGFMQGQINCGPTTLGAKAISLRSIILESPNLTIQQESKTKSLVTAIHEEEEVFAVHQEKLPLLDLFNHLREAGLPLGISEYFLALRAFQKGFGTADREALADLCRTLWVKSKDEEHLFNYHFKQVMGTVPSPTAAAPNRTEQEPLPSSSTPYVKQEVQGKEPNAEELPVPTTSTAISQELMEVEDEIQVAEAVQIATRSDGEVVINRFTQSDEYFPVTRRQMKQSWRHLRRMVREGPLVEIDIEATIARFSQQGIPSDPVLVPGRHATSRSRESSEMAFGGDDRCKPMS